MNGDTAAVRSRSDRNLSAVSNAAIFDFPDETDKARNQLNLIESKIPLPYPHELDASPVDSSRSHVIKMQGHDFCPQCRRRGN